MTASPSLLEQVSAGTTTALLEEWNTCAEDQRIAISEELYRRLYNELHQLASNYLRRERRGQTLQTTALVNDAFMRMVRLNELTLKSRKHFFVLAAQAMRQILIDHARRRMAAKNGRTPISIVDIDPPVAVRNAELIRFDDALSELQKIRSRAYEVVQLRFFTGLSFAEIADLLGLTTAEVNKEWKFARAWLLKELKTDKKKDAKPKAVPPIDAKKKAAE